MLWTLAMPPAKAAEAEAAGVAGEDELQAARVRTRTAAAARDMIWADIEVSSGFGRVTGREPIAY